MATVTAADRCRARVVAEALVAEAAAAGIDPPTGLALWDLAGVPVLSLLTRIPACEQRQNDLAVVLEGATSAEQRRTNGLHVTPAWLADHLVERALDDFDAPAGRLTLCDPACGGGAFLLAGARALHARGVSRSAIVRDLVWGADVDPVGLATAEAALALWAGEPPPPGRLVVGDALTSGADLWPDRPAPGFSAVVGNPPFLNQLGRATVRTADEAVRLRACFGDAVQPYTDAAWLFLLLACELAQPGGRITLVEPLSVVAARDARAVRSVLQRRAHLRELWVEDGRSFAASVKVCAPVLEVGTAALGDADRVWADRLADAIGAPRVRLRSRQRLGDMAEVVAGFRDEYYGLVPLVREAGPDDAGSPLITAGVLDWGRSRWSERATRFAKRSWRAPVVDLRQLDEQAPVVRAGLRWAERNLRPKVVVASQTRVVEAAVDEQGSWVPSVPVLAVLPQDAGNLWPIAAAVAAPAATAWLFRQAPGTALGRGALKIAAGDLSQLPLPHDTAAWSGAAAALRTYTAAPSEAALDAYVTAATAMYDSPAPLVAWWRDRLDVP